MTGSGIGTTDRTRRDIRVTNGPMDCGNRTVNGNSKISIACAASEVFSSHAAQAMMSTAQKQ